MRRRDHLHTHWHAIGRQAAGHGRGRVFGEVEQLGERRREDGLLAVDRSVPSAACGLPGHRGAQQHRRGLEQCFEFEVVQVGGVERGCERGRRDLTIGMVDKSTDLFGSFAFSIAAWVCGCIPPVVPEVPPMSGCPGGIFDLAFISADTGATAFWLTELANMKPSNRPANTPTMPKRVFS